MVRAGGALGKGGISSNTETHPLPRVVPLRPNSKTRQRISIKRVCLPGILVPGAVGISQHLHRHDHAIVAELVVLADAEGSILKRVVAEDERGCRSLSLAVPHFILARLRMILLAGTQDPDPRLSNYSSQMILQWKVRFQRRSVICFISSEITLKTI